jgi:histone acetyltransferase (RNA polymerase elongator complex component)
VFCNQKKITGVQTDVKVTDIKTIIIKHLDGITRSYFIEVAFYGGSFTALPMELQREFLLPVYQYVKSGKINAIRISTRPDCITEEILRQLKSMDVQTIELGAQSFDNHVLYQAERGHNAQAIRKAAHFIKAQGFTLGIQLMPGLPGDTAKSIFYSLFETVKLHPDIVRIYPTIVLTDTKMAAMYKTGGYVPLTLEEAKHYVAVMKLVFLRENIKVIRMGLQSSETLDDGKVVLAGPYHPAFGEMVDSYLFYLMAAAVLDEVAVGGENIYIHHALKDASKVRGSKNENTKQLKKVYQLQKIYFLSDLAESNTVEIGIDGLRYKMNLHLLERI